MPDGQGFLMPEPSWDLPIFVPDCQVESVLYVRGDMHIGGLMLRLVEELDVSRDWSDYAFWWPRKNIWLTKTRQTLNHYGVQGDACLEFITMHRPLRVQLPDLRFVDANIDFSASCFTAVKELCKEIKIRHSEELSFRRPLSQEHLKKNYPHVGVTPRQRSRGPGSYATMQSTTTTTNTMNTTAGNTNTMRSTMGRSGTLGGGGTMSQTGTINTRAHSPDITSTLSRHASYRGFTRTYNANMLVEDLGNLELSNSPQMLASDAQGSLLYPRNLHERARLNASWLDSHLSLYQQNVREWDTLELRFKYHEFYDLNARLDAARINQIYEQAKWSIISGEIVCPSFERRKFDSLQQQIEQRASNPIAEDIDNTNDDIDAALTELQMQLEGGGSSMTTVYDRTSFGPSRHNVYHRPANTLVSQQSGVAQANATTGTGSAQDRIKSVDFISSSPTTELSDSIRFMRVKKFTFKTFKRIYFVFRDTTLTGYRNMDDRMKEKVAFVIELRGCDVTPDVYVSHGKYGVRLTTPGMDGQTDYLLRFDSGQQYAKWVAAFKLASRGSSCTDPTYEDEVRRAAEMINIQHPQTLSPVPSSISYQNYGSNTLNNNNTIYNNNNNPHADEYPKYSKSLTRVGFSEATRILESNHSGAKYPSATEYKLNYIRAWRALPDCGVHMFVVKFDGNNKEEILGVGTDRLILIDAGNGNHLRVWPYSHMKTWRINWDSRTFMVQSEDGELTFSCLSADCKIPHEFIGGYVFLSMRSKDNNQNLNEELFYKLTRGWDD